MNATNANLQWRVHPLTLAHAQALCGWRYPPPYNLYNWSDWATMQHEQIEFADPLIRDNQYAAVVDEDSQLVGFVQFFPIVGVTRLGLGLHPALCGQSTARGTGQGLGVPFVKLLVQEALRRAPQNEIDLEVLTWNTRAIRTYERAGFHITDTYEKLTPTGNAMFHCMVYDPATSPPA
ncbi:GNAT family N-acetyltransferase [Paenibacillus aestuarii]|uniref:GNAT family protein n=1 Tax=Paenibacillus aestuarii TaxID=516965 RepID=A0ABW0KAR8_9BACL|nr:GNAT family protein [Paenibacillus aestuarii]